MDTKCVRLLRLYPAADPAERAIYIDEDARYALMAQWGDSVRIKGRYDAKGVTVRPLDEIDQNGFIARAGQKLLDELYVDYGEEVMLIRE